MYQERLVMLLVVLVVVEEVKVYRSMKDRLMTLMLGDLIVIEELVDL
jgi:hypothetical protein